MNWTIFFILFLQGGEFGTDEDEEMSPMFPNAIEVFDLAENEDMLSPVEMDPEKLTHKFKEVMLITLLSTRRVQKWHVQKRSRLPLHASFKKL